MPLPSKRDAGELRARLQSWLTDALGHACEVGELSIPEGTGMSSETLLFDLVHDGRTEPMVARLRPDMNDWPVFRTYDLAAQAGAMRWVAARSDVPVPNVRWFEADESHLGAPFFIMDRVSGSAPTDMPPYVFGGSFLDAFTAEELRTLQDNAVKIHARLHAIPLDDEVSTFTKAPGGGESAEDALRRQLADFAGYYDWARDGVRYPIIDDSIAWLDANFPTGLGQATLNWGDARPGNILFDGVNPVAVLDWEMVDVGPREVDLGWMVFLHRFFQDIAAVFQMPGFPDFLRREDVADTYRAVTGVEIADLHWFEVFAGARFAAISLRTSGRGVAYGTMEPPADPEGLIMHRDLLRSMIDGTIS